MSVPAARWLSLVRGGYGLALLCRPGLVLRLAGATGDRPASRVARILGARQLAQAALTASEPNATVLTLGVAVDVAHALSMLGLGAADQRRRRDGYLDAGAAAAFAVAGALTAGRVQAATDA